MPGSRLSQAPSLASSLPLCDQGASSPRLKHVQEEFAALFPEHRGERLLFSFSCALQKEILAQGRMYLTPSLLAFYSSILGWKTILVIPLSDILMLEKKNTAILFPNAIKVVTLLGKYLFASFVSRNSVFTKLYATWQQFLLNGDGGLLVKNSLGLECFRDSVSLFQSNVLLQEDENCAEDATQTTASSSDGSSVITDSLQLSQSLANNPETSFSFPSTPTDSFYAVSFERFLSFSYLKESFSLEKKASPEFEGFLLECTNCRREKIAPYSIGNERGFEVRWGISPFPPLVAVVSVSELSNKKDLKNFLAEYKVSFFEVDRIRIVLGFHYVSLFYTKVSISATILGESSLFPRIANWLLQRRLKEFSDAAEKHFLSLEHGTSRSPKKKPHGIPWVNAATIGILAIFAVYLIFTRGSKRGVSKDDPLLADLTLQLAKLI